MTIDVENHFKDAEGNSYSTYMTDHTRCPQKEVLNGLCNFICDEAIGGAGFMWRGFVELTPGTFIYWVKDKCPLFYFLKARVQHLDNFLCFTKNGKRITINHFGPFCRNRSLLSQNVMTALKSAEALAKDAKKERWRMKKDMEIWGKENLPLSKDKLPKLRQRLPSWKPTKSKAFEKVHTKVLKKGDELVAIKAQLNYAVIAGKEIAKVIAITGAKRAITALTKDYPWNELLVGLCSGALHAYNGKFVGAGLDLFEAMSPQIFGTGTATSHAFKAMRLGYDIYEIQKRFKEEEEKQKALYVKKLQEWRSKKYKMIKLMEQRIEEISDAIAGCNHCVESCYHLIHFRDEV